MKMNDSSKMAILNLLLEDSSSEDEDTSSENELETILSAVMPSIRNISGNVRMPRRIEFMDEVVTYYSDEEFKKNFRMERANCAKLSADFEKFCPKKKTRGGRQVFQKNSYIPLFLWFAGNKCSIGQVSVLFGLSKSMVHKVIDTVMDFLSQIAPDVINFPQTREEKETCARGFYELSGFPNVLGCVDGSYISIKTPALKIRPKPGQQEHPLPLLTLQGICDSQMKFLDIFISPPAQDKAHDAIVFNMSPIFQRLPNICESNYHILGDGAYELKEWLLTPFRCNENISLARKKYNNTFCKTRVTIDKTFWMLKKRFVQLERIDMTDTDRITKFITSCCVLHNICITAEDYMDDIPSAKNFDSQNEDVSEDSLVGDVATEQQKLGQRKRISIVKQLS